MFRFKINAMKPLRHRAINISAKLVILHSKKIYLEKISNGNFPLKLIVAQASKFLIQLLNLTAPERYDQQNYLSHIFVYPFP